MSVCVLFFDCLEIKDQLIILKHVLMMKQRTGTGQTFSSCELSSFSKASWRLIKPSVSSTVSPRVLFCSRI